MEELDNNELAEAYVPEVELTIEETISSQLSALIDESELIVTIDFARIKEFWDSIILINTIKKLTMVPDLAQNILESISMFEEETVSTSSSSNFLNIAKSLFSNTEIDYFKIFGDTND